MTRYHRKTFPPVILILGIVNIVYGDLRDFMKIEDRRNYWPNTKFGYGGLYSKLSNAEESRFGLETRDVKPLMFGDPETKVPIDVSDATHPNITWDASHWTEKLDVGQLTGIDLDRMGNVAILSRGDRIWGSGTFDDSNKFDCSKGAIKENTIHLYDRYGKKIREWGKNMFYMPHGITIDRDGNYWITDVALHQVLKFDGKDIEKHFTRSNDNNEHEELSVDCRNPQNRFDRSIFKPSMILGVAFEPGHDNQRFCKPTAVAVANNGDFFVSDGYCNSRVVKFNKNGVRITQWGRAWSTADGSKNHRSYAMYVPHGIALDEKNDLIYVADRENGRVMCYSAENGSFHREYTDPVVGTKVYNIDYASGKLYIVNGRDVFANPKFNVRGFVVDVNSGGIISQLTPGGNDMLAPHDITVSPDGSEIYVVELDARKVYRFFQGGIAKVGDKISSNFGGPETMSSNSDLRGSSDEKGWTTGSVLLSIVIGSTLFIGLCLVVAAVVAKCQKRGCLLSVRKREYWKTESRENFKLSSLLETRQGKSFKVLEKRPNTRDFSKLNTEPETSEDDGVDDSLVI